MEPPCLTEAAARKLLREWARLRSSFFTTLITTDDNRLVHGRIRVGLLQNHDVASNDWNALKFRRVMEAINAVACCRGFGLRERTAFWRRELAPLGDDDDDDHDDEQLDEDRTSIHAVADDMLQHYRLLVELADPAESLAWAVATCCSMDPASTAMGERREVLKRVRPFLAREPPMLDIELAHESGRRVLRPVNYWELLKHTLLDVDRMWKVQSTVPHAQQRLAMVSDGNVEADELIEISASLAIDRIELRELTLTVDADDPSAAATHVRKLMRELVRVNTVRRLAWRFKRCERQCLAAVFSAVPSMTALKSISVACDDLTTNNTLQGAMLDEGVKSYYVWASYALLTRALDDQEFISVDLTFVPGSHELMDQALQSLVPLVDLVEPNEGVTPAVLQHGASALVNGCTVLSAKYGYARSRHGPTAESWFTAWRAQRVTVVAIFRLGALVVWPGLGLVWTTTQCLREWETRHQSIVVSSSNRLLVTSFSCGESAAAAIVPAVELMGVDVKRLSLAEVLPEHGEYLMEILRLCPRLNELHVRSMRPSSHCSRPTQTEAATSRR